MIGQPTLASLPKLSGYTSHGQASYDKTGAKPAPLK